MELLVLSTSGCLFLVSFFWDVVRSGIRFHSNHRRRKRMVGVLNSANG